METPRWFQRLWIRAAAGSITLVTALNGLTQDTTDTTSSTPVTTNSFETLKKQYEECIVNCGNQYVSSYLQTYNSSNITDCITGCNNIHTQMLTIINHRNAHRAPPSHTAAPTENHSENNRAHLGIDLGGAAGVTLLRAGVGMTMGLGLILYRCIKRHCRERREYERVPTDTNEDDEEQRFNPYADEMV